MNDCNRFEKLAVSNTFEFDDLCGEGSEGGEDAAICHQGCTCAGAVVNLEDAIPSFGIISGEFELLFGAHSVDGLKASAEDPMQTRDSWKGYLLDKIKVMCNVLVKIQFTTPK